MALKLIQPKTQNYGQFDGLDSVVTTCKGGEVVSFTYVNLSQGVDKHASDVNDGYVTNLSQKRPAVTTTLVSGMRPLFLVDDGTAGYGTLFGRIVGSAVGQQVVGGTVLGPHTATGSGKLTLWDGPGLYGVTLDACDTNANTGLQPTNLTMVGGAPLYATAAGLLTPNITISFEGIVVGRFFQFTTNGSMVTTPNSLVAALNTPAGNVASVVGSPFIQAEFYFFPEI